MLAFVRNKRYTCECYVVKIEMEDFEMSKKEERGSFSGRLGFVLAAAASAVGLGNIWRFPYLAAKDGGGLFLLVYVCLALTFGFTLLTTEIAIGRKSGKSPLQAYGTLCSKMNWIGALACIIPAMITPYYSSIGGWILKYMTTFVTGHGVEAAADGYFGGFITSQWSPIIWFLIYMALNIFVVFKGVNDGIEKMSKFMMPVLVILIAGISVFSLTLKHTDAAGVTRTGLEGFMIYVIPNFDGLTLKGFLNVLMDAMGQLFYSISVAMGIMVAYGSYVKKDTDLVKSVNQIEIFDTLVAFLAGMMIIPAVFTFMGTEGMTAGPSLMFVALPKVFQAMGGVGNIIGIIFFVTVSFAALTSSVSLIEAITSSVMDKWHMTRKKALTLVSAYIVIVGVIVCLGYNVFYFDYTLPNGSVGQILDILDYISNSLLMPIVSIATCIMVGWMIKPKAIIDEVTRNGETFGRKGLYIVMIKFVTPILLTLLLLQALGMLNWLA